MEQRQGRAPRWIAAALGVLALGFTACGTTVAGTGAPVVAPEPAQRGTVEPSPTPTPTPTPPEQVVEVPGPTVAVPMATGRATVSIDTYAWRSTGTGERSKPPEDHYLVLRMTITATEGTVSVNPLYFSVRLPDGTSVEPTMGADGNEPLLGTTDLAAGETIDGVVTFDVPAQPTMLVITNELDAPAATTTIPAPA